MKKVHTNPFRVAADERMRAVQRSRHEVFCQLRQGYATWSKFAAATKTSMSLLQGLQVERHRLTEGICRGLEAGLGTHGLFGLMSMNEVQVTCLPDHYRNRLSCVEAKSRLDYFRYLRLQDFLRAYPKSSTLNQETHVGRELGFPSGSSIYSITRYGQRVTEEITMVFEAVPGFDGWFDPARMTESIARIDT